MTSLTKLDLLSIRIFKNKARNGGGKWVFRGDKITGNDPRVIPVF